MESAITEQKKVITKQKKILKRYLLPIKKMNELVTNLKKDMMI